MTTFPSLYEMENEQWIADVYAKGPFSLGGREHDLTLPAGRDRELVGVGRAATQRERSRFEFQPGWIF